jgi:hypothetical protein
MKFSINSPHDLNASKLAHLAEGPVLTTCPFTGLDATRRCAAVVELLAQVEHACGSCPMSPGLAASRVTWSRGCGL